MNARRISKNCCPYLDTTMSGSPIVQDGRLIGAVTHVFVNDPTRGYAIFAENMVNTINSLKTRENKAS